MRRRAHLSYPKALPFGAPILFAQSSAFEFLRASTHGAATLRTDQVDDRRK